MPDEVVTLHLSQSEAAFLRVNSSYLAITTRQAMARPGLHLERHLALASRARVLESTEDAVRGAMLEVPITNKTPAPKLAARNGSMAGRRDAPTALASTLKVLLQAQETFKPALIGTEEQVALSQGAPRARQLQWFDEPERVPFNPMINRRPLVETDRYGYGALYRR